MGELPTLPSAHELADAMAQSAVVLPPKEKEEEKVNNIERSVNASYSDAPILIEVAKCESSMKQFTKNGDIFRGEANDYDVGVMQINEFYHSDTAKRLGFNLHTLEGNIGYGRYLYEKYGTKPWSASEKCWGKFREMAQESKSKS